VTLFTPDERPPVEWLFLDAGTPEGSLASWLELALPRCSWSCHVVVAGRDPESLLLDTVVSFLEAEPVALVHLHLLADGRFGASPPVDRLLEAAEVFQREAYRERTGSRLVPLPILEVSREADLRPTLDAAGELAGRLAKPSLLLWQAPSAEDAAIAAALGLRVYLGSDPASTTALEVFTDAHILDGSIERMGGSAALLGPCRPHQVVGEGRIFACARARQHGVSRTRLGDTARPEWRPDVGLCPGCLADTVAGMGPSLDANLRRPEGRELALRVSASLLDAGEPGPAAAVASTAESLSDSRDERAEALIHEGLCLLAAGRLPEADRAFFDARAAGAEAGLTAYHRARVQVAWRDDIEALERYAEALESGAAGVSADDLHFEMAMSHIRIEEWPEARAHLAQAGAPTAAIAFNLGVCDLNDDHAERALGHFDRALELGPPADDLGRIRFFRGFCLKELGRYEEAVDDLRLAIALEQAELAHHNSLGFCLFKLGRHAEAVECFERAVSVDPTSAVDWANLGVNLERLGETERSAEMYLKALAMDPTIGFAREGLERVGED
jgi:tetratricopeptide (TPR) repeat protein